MAKNSNTVVVKQKGKYKMYSDNKKVFYWTLYGMVYLNHGGKCIMFDNMDYKVKRDCFKNYAEARETFEEEFNLIAHKRIMGMKI